MTDHKLTLDTLRSAAESLLAQLPHCQGKSVMGAADINCGELAKYSDGCGAFCEQHLPRASGVPGLGERHPAYCNYVKPRWFDAATLLSKLLRKDDP